MSARAGQSLPLWAESESWAIVRRTPEGEAVADAYLSTRGALARLIVQVQVATSRGATVASVEAMRLGADRAQALVDEPLGAHWTREHGERRRVLGSVLRHLEAAERTCDRTLHWVSGQELLQPVCGTWNWTRMGWNRLSLVQAIGDAALPGDLAALGTALGNAQRLYHLLGYHAAGEAGEGHPEPDAADPWGDAAGGAAPTCEQCRRGLDECDCFGTLERD